MTGPSRLPAWTYLRLSVLIRGSLLPTANCLLPALLLSHLTLIACKIFSYSMRSTLTVSLPATLRREMERAAASEHRNASEFVRDAIRTKLWQKALDDSRDVLVPAARARGIYTDEDVFRAVS